MSRLFRAAVFGALVCGAAAPASAQGSRAQPIHVFRGLFGPTESEQQRNRRLFASIAIYGAADDNASFATGTDIADEALQRGRWYQGAQAQLAFKRQRPRSALTFSASSGIRYYPALHDVTTSQHGVALNAEMITSPHFRIQLNGSARYAPNFLVQIGAAADDTVVGRQRLMDYGGGASFIVTPNRTSELLLSTGAGYSQFFDAPDYSSKSARVRYTRRLSRDFSLRLGYGDGDAGRSDGVRTRLQDIEIGVNYNRGMVLSPRTSIGFSSGSALVSDGVVRKFTLVGAAFVKTQLSARWSIDAGYDRSLQTVPTAPRPFVTDAGHATLAGYLTRRTAVKVTPVCSRGVDPIQPAAGFTSCSSTTRLEFALNRFWALYTEHYYYQYLFSPGADLSFGVPRLTRQGARFGLALWAPVIR